VRWTLCVSRLFKCIIVCLFAHSTLLVRDVIPCSVSPLQRPVLLLVIASFGHPSLATHLCSFTRLPEIKMSEFEKPCTASCFGLRASKSNAS